MNATFKSTDALMQHLRDHGIAISGDTQKQQLINTGYFHGYKGYRFFETSFNKLPFTSYNEINATVQYDTKLKSLLYGKMMFIETALKNIALNTIMAETGSSSVYDMYDKVVSSYKNAPAGTREDLKKKYQNDKLNLQGSIQNVIAHNDVVYDTRFRKMDASKPMKQCLIFETGLPYINFKTIGDYIILICYFLNLLKVSKTEIKEFIPEFENTTKEYKNSVGTEVSAITIHPDLSSRMTILKEFI
ncbi:MAG: Abi family protein [Lachnospiraceae bacterium]|nr:Abi family protein [Lachnospiraceae bacterium]